MLSVHGVLAGAGEAGAAAVCLAAGEGDAAPEDGGPAFAAASAGELETAAPCGAAVGAGDAPAGAVCAGGVAIGPAREGFFCANSATVSSIARSIGIRATPLFLSTQAYVVSSFWFSSCKVFSFSMRFFARASS